MARNSRIRTNDSLIEYQLSAKEIKFAEGILKNLPQTQAVIDAGYSSKSPQTQAYRLLQIPGIKKYIQQREFELAEKRRKEVEVDDIWITIKFKEILERCMQAEPVMRRNADGELEQAIDEETGRPLFTFDSAGAIKAAENLAKHIGYYEKDNKQRQTVIKIGAVQNIANYFFADEEQEGEAPLEIGEQ